MRNTKTSNIKKKELFRKYQAKRNVQPASNVAKVDPAQTRPQQQRIVTPGPAAYNRPNEEGRVVSRDLAGEEIKKDAEGNYDLEQVKDKGVLEQFARGVAVPTEQFIQQPKDIIEGVRAEDQVMKESGLDLVINPLITPLAQAQDRGFTDKQWYSPIGFVSNDIARSIGLKDNQGLPSFLRPDPNEKRDFLTGMGDNVGIIGDVVTHENAGNLVGQQFEKSGERFMEAPAYYIGSAVGELPYWVIGVGEAKAAATVAVKAAAYSARTGGKVANPVLLAKAYKVEKAAEKLEKAANLENKLATTDGSIRAGGAIKEASKILKSAYGTQIRNYKGQNKQNRAAIKQLEKEGGRETDIKKLETSIALNDGAISSITAKSNKLKKLQEEVKRINKIDPEIKTSASDKVTLKSFEKQKFNKTLQEELLPDVRRFRNRYVSEVKGIAISEKADKFAKQIETLPDIKNKITKYLEPRVRVSGEEDVVVDSTRKAVGEKLMENLKAGKYEGSLGPLRFQKDAIMGGVESFVNSKYTFYGRKKQKYIGVGETVSGMLSNLKVINVEELKRIKETTDSRIKELEVENKKIELSGLDDSPNKARYQDTIEQNKAEIKALKRIQKNEFKDLSFRTNVNPKTGVEYVMNYDELFKTSPRLREVLEPTEITTSYRPSVSVTQTDGVITGTAGDFNFWMREIPVAQAEKVFGADNVQSKKKFTLRTVGPKRYKKKVAIPKSEQVVEVLELYKADDALKQAGREHSGVNAAYILPKGTTQREIDLVKHQLYLEEYKGTDLLSKSFPEGSIILQEKRLFQKDKNLKDIGEDLPKEEFGSMILPAVKQRRTKVDVIDKKDRKGVTDSDAKSVTGERKLTVQEIRENRLIAQNRYDANWYNVEFNKLKSVSTDKLSSQQQVQRSKQLEELTKKKESIEQRQELFEKMGIKEVGDPKGTLFSVPYKKMESLIEDDKIRMESTMVVDRRTGKKYFRYVVPDDIAKKETEFATVRGRTSRTELWEVLDDDFHPSDVINKNTPITTNKDGTPVRVRVMTDRVKGGSITEAAAGRNLSQADRQFPPTDLYGKPMTWSEETKGWVGQTLRGREVDYIDLRRTIDKFGSEEFVDKSSFDNKLRRLDPDEVLRLTEGDKIGQKLYDLEMSKLDVDQKKTKIKTTEEGVDIATRTTKDIITSKTKIKALRKGESMVGSFAKIVKTDNFEWIRARGDGLPEAQPNFLSQRTESVFFGGKRYTGFGPDGSEIQKTRALLAVSEAEKGIPQPETPAGFVVTPVYQMDSIFNIPEQRQLTKLQEMQDRLDKREFNELKENKLPPYEAMETYARGSGPHSSLRFKEQILDLYEKKVKGSSKGMSNAEKRRILSEGGENEYMRIVESVKPLITTSKKGKWKKGKIVPTRDLKEWAPATGKSGLKALFKKKVYDKDSIVGTVPVTMRIQDPIFSTKDRIQDYFSRKKNAEVEDVDPRLRASLVKAYEKVDQITYLTRTDKNNLKRFKGTNLTADQRATKQVESANRGKTRVQNKDGTYKVVDIVDVQPAQKLTGLIPKPTFESVSSKTNIVSKLSDEEFDMFIEKMVMKKYGLVTGLKSSSQLGKEIDTFSTFERLVKDTRDGKRNAGKQLNDFKNDYAEEIQSAVNQMTIQKDKQSQISPKTAERVNPEGRSRFEPGKVAKAVGQEPGFEPGGGLGLSSLFQQPLGIPQAYGQEESQLESIQQTVQSSFDGITKGGVKIGENIQQTVKLSDSPTGGILGVNRNLIPQQTIDTEISATMFTGIAQASAQASVQASTPIQAGGLSTVAAYTTRTTTDLNQLIGQFSPQSFTPATPRTALQSQILQRVMPSDRPLSRPMAGMPRITPPILPVIPLTPYGQPMKQRRPRRYKKKSGKAYWQTPQNWYDPYYWGGKDQLGPGYTVFKGKEPAKVRKYDQKYFGMDLGNLW